LRIAAAIRWTFGANARDRMLRRIIVFGTPSAAMV
jgi:hypothetical protein